jgi:CO/xanthine dehydrogenase Mo-binding subunit
MLHMGILFAGRPHARIIGLEISHALEMPGVIAVLTAKDVPSNCYGLMRRDQPVLCDQVVRFVGDQIAAVIAVSPEQASAARDQIRVAFEDLPVVSSPEQALQPESPMIHPDYPGNILSRARIRRGDTEAAFKDCDLIFEHTYQTPMQEHAYLEPEAGLAFRDDAGRITVYAAGQNVHDDQRQIAQALQIEPQQVRVIYGPIGGAFGGREDVSVQILLALAAWTLKRPVKIQWSRRESIIGHCKRHAMTIRHKWGATNDGRVLAAEVDITADAGPYAYTSPSVLECLHALCIGPYDIPNVRMDGRMVCTNNVPGGAFRGFGGPQATFASEMHLSQIADRLGIDPLTMREINCLTGNSRLPTQSSLQGSNSLPQLMTRLAHEAGLERGDDGWRFPAYPSDGDKRRGFGIAIGFRQSAFGYGFPEASEARVILRGAAEVECAEIHCAAADVGQGSRAALIQIAASILSLPTEAIRLLPCDSSLIGDTGAASGSRLTIMAGEALKRACRAALREWEYENRPASGHVRWEAPRTTAPDPDSGACDPNLSYSYAAHGVQVEVDMETGAVELQNVVVVQDTGTTLNPQQVGGQIEGAVIQALGWSIYEHFALDQGHVLSDRLSTYEIPTALDIPTALKPVIYEHPDPLSSFGFRGVGEIPFVPFAPALMNAIKQATGVWITTLPAFPERLLGRLSERSAP